MASLPDLTRDGVAVACRELAAMLETSGALLGGDHYCGEDHDTGPVAVRCIDLVFAVAREQVAPADAGPALEAAMAVAALVCDKALLTARLRDSLSFARGESPVRPWPC